MPGRYLYTVFFYVAFLSGVAHLLKQTDVETLHQWFVYLQSASFENFVVQSPRFAAVQDYLVTHNNPAHWEKVVCFLAFASAGFVGFFLLMISLFTFEAKQHWENRSRWLKPDFFEKRGLAKFRILYTLTLVVSYFFVFLLQPHNFDPKLGWQDFLIQPDFGFFFFSFEPACLYMLIVIFIFAVGRALLENHLRRVSKNTESVTPPSA